MNKRLYKIILFFSLLVCAALVLNSCENQIQSNQNEKVKEQSTQIKELEDVVKKLEESLTESVTERDILADTLENMVGNTHSIDTLSIKLSFLATNMYSNNFSISGIPLSYAKALANHLSISTYVVASDQEVKYYTEKMDQYKEIGVVNFPYIYVKLQRPLDIALKTTEGSVTLQPIELLVVIQDSLKPYIFIKQNNIYIGYKLLTDSSKYNFDILFKQHIDAYQNELNFFQDY